MTILKIFILGRGTHRLPQPWKGIFPSVVSSALRKQLCGEPLPVQDRRQDFQVAEELD